MPYIPQDSRGGFIQMIRVPSTPGELNYLICSLLNAYIRELGGVSYASLNEVIGVLSCVQLEYYRRVAVPVEEFKAQQNGDLPWPSLEELVAKVEKELQP